MAHPRLEICHVTISPSHTTRLYGRLPTRAPLAIFASPFIRCVQTADAIASELEGLQKVGLHSASATRICIEPGLMEDMSYMAHLRQHEPWFLNVSKKYCGRRHCLR